MSEVCQCCGKEIKLGEPAIQVSYGYIELTARCPVNGRFIATRKDIDCFHVGCDVAIRSKERGR